MGAVGPGTNSRGCPRTTAESATNIAIAATNSRILRVYTDGVPASQFPRRSAVSVVGGTVDIADQRSSKFAVGSLCGSIVGPDRMVAAVAATVTRATATKPVIVRCFVIRTSFGPQSPFVWVTGTSRRFNSELRERTDRTRKLSQIQIAAQTLRWCSGPICFDA